MSDTNIQSLKPTRETYDPLQQAYETLNRALFDGALPNCLITLQRHKHSYGDFCGDRFGRADGTFTDEIALNPSHFRDRSQEEILSTLAHEMVHLWQHHFGNSSSNSSISNNTNPLILQACCSDSTQSAGTTKFKKAPTHQ